MPFALVVIALIGSGLIGLLLLNTVIAQDAFVLQRLHSGVNRLADREQELQQLVAAEDSPDVLAQRARALGMVPGGDPLFLQLPGGAVLGNPTAALPPPAPPPLPASPTPSASPSPAASRSASPSASHSPSPAPSPKATAPKATAPKATPKPTAPAPRPTGTPSSRPTAQTQPAPTGSRP